jgi:hypothetical protein
LSTWLLRENGAGGMPTLLLFGLQARHDPDKLDVTLEEAGILRSRARQGPDGGGSIGC